MRQPRGALAIPTLLGAVLAWPTFTTPVGAKPVDFTRDVRPILSDRASRATVPTTSARPGSGSTPRREPRRDRFRDAGRRAGEP